MSDDWSREREARYVAAMMADALRDPVASRPVAMINGALMVRAAVEAIADFRTISQMKPKEQAEHTARIDAIIMKAAREGVPPDPDQAQ